MTASDDSKRAYKIFYDPFRSMKEKERLLAELLPNAVAQGYLNSIGKAELESGPESEETEARLAEIRSLLKQHFPGSGESEGPDNASLIKGGLPVDPEPRS